MGLDPQARVQEWSEVAEMTLGSRPQPLNLPGSRACSIRRGIIGEGPQTLVWDETRASLFCRTKIT